jgi:hypothetical protein
MDGANRQTVTRFYSSSTSSHCNGTPSKRLPRFLLCRDVIFVTGSRVGGEECKLREVHYYFLCNSKPWLRHTIGREAEAAGSNLERTKEGWWLRWYSSRPLRTHFHINSADYLCDCQCFATHLTVHNSFNKTFSITKFQQNQGKPSALCRHSETFLKRRKRIKWRLYGGSPTACFYMKRIWTVKIG